MKITKEYEKDLKEKAKEYEKGAEDREIRRLLDEALQESLDKRQ